MAPIWGPFSLYVLDFCTVFSSHDFTSIFHRFSDGFSIDFPSFWDVDLAPFPDLANLLNWNKYGTRALFYHPRELRFFMFFLSFSVSIFASIFIYFWTSSSILFGTENGGKPGIFDIRFVDVFWTSFFIDFDQK